MFTISPWVSRNTGDGDDGGGVHDCNCPKLPLAVTINPVPPVINFDDIYNPLNLIWNYVNIPLPYQVPKLMYILFRNGIEQVPLFDFSVVGTRFIFVRHLDPLQNEVFRLYGYGFSA